MESKKITKGLLIQIHNLLSQARLDACTVKERVDVIKTVRKLRGEVEAFEGFVTDVREKNADIIGSGDEVKIAELDKLINEEANKPIETEDIGTLTEDAVMHLLESNNGWSAGLVLLLEDIFVKE